MTAAAALLRCMAFALPAAAAEPPPHHVLGVTLDPAARTIRGVDRVTLHGRAAPAFALLRGFTVDRLLVDGRAVAVPAGGGHVALPGDAGAAGEVVVEYRGALAAPDPDRGPDGAVAGPEGSFLPSRRWFPDFGGRFTYQVTVDVPEPQRAVTPGRLVAETTGAGRYRATFASEAPADELSLIAGPWRITERFHRGWRLRTYFDDEVADLAPTYLDRTAGYLDLYDGWIGTYPFAGFSVVAGPLPVGLGFRGLAYLGSRVLRLPFIPDTSLGHEVLHSWWGAGVQPGDGGNWAEGLTTFMADYTFAERRGAEAARDQRLAWLREFALLPMAEDRPLTAFRGRSHAASQATGYHKAAFVFVMLRDEIGADAFTLGVRRFWRAHRLATATWSELEAAFSAAARVPLGRFFAQWTQRAGAPALTVRDVHAGEDRVTFALEQPPPPYTLGVPAHVETAGAAVTRVVRLDGESRRFAVDTGDPPRALAIDPNLRLFRRLARDEVPPVIREVAFDPAAVVVIAAAADAGAAAREVATRLLEREPERFADALPARPSLVVGTTAEVTALLEDAGAAGAPEGVAGRGSARAWAARRTDGAAVVAVAGESAAALRAVARPLPHYGAQSFVVFDGARAVDRGVWPAGPSPLRVRVDPSGRP